MDQVCRDLRVAIKLDQNSANAARTLLFMDNESWKEYIHHHDKLNGSNSLAQETKVLCCKVARFQKVTSSMDTSIPTFSEENDASILLDWPKDSQLPLDVVDDGNDTSQRYDQQRANSNDGSIGAAVPAGSVTESSIEEAPKLPSFMTARQILGGPSAAKVGTGSANGPSKSRSENSTGPATGDRQSQYDYVLKDERLQNIDPKLAEKILAELVTDCTNVTWESIAGLADVKSRVKEMVVMPMLRPDLFRGIRAPGKGLLLFGPPGTGKTMIGKCIASQSKATFFNISSATLTSKWVGEGEKMVKAMFAIARVMAPTVVFIDEIDSLLLQRNDSDHESSRRMKTEFLLQFDGCGTEDEEKLLIVGATNRPEGLDEAARRRFTKRLYVPLPDIEARIGITRNLMKEVKHSLSEDDYKKIAEMTEGYSGSDMKRVCQEASMIAVRDAINQFGIMDLPASEIRPVVLVDFENALKKTKTSVAASEITRYEVFNSEFGALDV